MDRGRGFEALRSTGGSCERGRAGRAGNMGGWSSSTLSELLGGVLNGESLSAVLRLPGGEPAADTAAGDVGARVGSTKGFCGWLINCCEGILGLSERLMGGGAALCAAATAATETPETTTGAISRTVSRWSLSLLSSADRRGGGGDGGWEGESRGDLRASSVVAAVGVGVCGRLGILGSRGDEEGDKGALTTESGLRKKLDWSTAEGARLPARPLGGDCGG